MTNSEKFMTPRQRRIAEVRAAKYADLLVDYISKMILGTEKNKDLLISLINSLLPSERAVTDLEYIPNETGGETGENKKFVLDLRCRTEDGTQFLVEIQNYFQTSFYKRCVAYAGAAYSGSLKQGDEYDELSPVYLIALMSETATEGHDMHRVVADGQVVFRYRMQEKDTGDVPSDTIMCIFVELERFVKSYDECASMQDKWFYCLKNSIRMNSLPANFRNEVFEKLFEQLRISKFDRNTMDAYLRQKMAEMDEIDRIKSATLFGEEKGIEKEKVKIARNLKDMGLNDAIIMQATGLTQEQVNAL